MQNYATVVVPKMEEDFRKLGAKFEGNPDIAIIFAGVGEMNSLLQFFSDYIKYFFFWIGWCNG